MESFTTTKTNYRITLKSNKNVDVNSVYNRIFFSSFDIDGVRIYKHGTEDEVFDDKESTFNISRKCKSSRFKSFKLKYF